MPNSTKWYKAICRAAKARRGEKHSPSHKRKIGKASKALWKDPGYRKRMCKIRKQSRTPEVIKRFKKSIKKSRASRSLKMKKFWKENYDEMCKKRKKQAMKYHYKITAALKRRWADPKFHTKMCKIRKTQSKGNQMRQPNASFYRTKYKGAHGNFWMRSSWEVCFALWLDHCGIQWEYEKKKFMLSKGHYYTPDFYLPDQDEYVELKGWMTNKDEKKLAKFAKKYPAIKLYVFGGKHLAKVLEFKKKIA